MFKFSYFINIPVFAIALVVGLIFVHLGNENDHRKIFVYPSPENMNVLQYKDAAGLCFRYKQTKVPCPASAADISTIPIQT